MATAMDGKAVRQVPYGLYARFNRFLERYLPAGLYPRSLIIVIAPVILLQAIMATVILDHHWEKVSRILSRSIAGEMAFVIASYESSPKTPEAIANLQAFTASISISTLSSRAAPACRRPAVPAVLDARPPADDLHRAQRRQAVLDRYRAVGPAGCQGAGRAGTSCSASSRARSAPMPPTRRCSCGGSEARRSSCCWWRSCSCATRSAPSCSWRTRRRASEWAATWRSSGRAGRRK
jgi:hypothetical protein